MIVVIGWFWWDLETNLNVASHIVNESITISIVILIEWWRKRWIKTIKTSDARKKTHDVPQTKLATPQRHGPKRIPTLPRPRSPKPKSNVRLRTDGWNPQTHRRQLETQSRLNLPTPRLAPRQRIRKRTVYRKRVQTLWVNLKRQRPAWRTDKNPGKIPGRRRLYDKPLLWQILQQHTTRKNKPDSCFYAKIVSFNDKAG